MWDCSINAAQKTGLATIELYLHQDVFADAFAKLFDN